MEPEITEKIIKAFDNLSKSLPDCVDRVEFTVNSEDNKKECIGFKVVDHNKIEKGDV
jgi:hypothetical protein